jgi:hypothetical protein
MRTIFYAILVSVIVPESCDLLRILSLNMVMPWNLQFSQTVRLNYCNFQGVKHVSLEHTIRLLFIVYIKF